MDHWRLAVTDAPLHAALSALREEQEETPMNMREAFTSDPQRFARFSLTDGDLLLDWSKCAVDASKP